MIETEVLLKSDPVTEILRMVAQSVKWGKITLIIKDGKVVMSTIEKDIKHS